MEQQLYELPDGWEWKTLTDVTQFIGGSQPPKPEFSEEKKDGYTRLIQIRDYKTDNYIVFVRTKSTKKFCETDDVMIGRYGPPVFQILRGLKGAYNVALMKALPNEEILTKDYLYHFLKSSPIQNYIIGLSQRAAGQTGVNKNALEKYAIPLPPLSEQKRIVEKLDALLSRIDQAVNNLQECLGLTEALFDSSMDGAFNPHGSVKNAEGIYELPDGWEWKILTDVTKFIGGSQPPKSEFSEEKKEGYTRLIQIRDYKTANYIVYVRTESTKKFCDADDIMIGRYGPPVFQILRGLKGAYNVALMKALPNDEILTKDYLYHFLKSSPIQNYIIGLSQRAAGQTGVNKNALEKYAIPLPPLPVQERIVEKIAHLSFQNKELKEKLQGQIDDLIALKASLLDAAFRGEL